MLYSRMYVKDEPWSFYIIRQYEDRDGGDNLLVRVEREKDEEAFSEWILPDISCKKSYGFSEDELFQIRSFLIDNEAIMWDDYREEVNKNAQSIA